MSVKSEVWDSQSSPLAQAYRNDRIGNGHYFVFVLNLNASTKETKNVVFCATCECDYQQELERIHEAKVGRKWCFGKLHHCQGRHSQIEIK